ncbi:MAG TPA: peptidoglycan-binding protein [Micromonosporaceae bacterium]|nr:peptidoglycan-binding protein [Micromonosporaceae bacterium]HCU50312.1 peptidoglycan-binding protein [Micromonosporaceae bacterium]
MKKSSKILLAVVLGSGLLAVSGLSASIWVKSPQEKAAEAAPPTASVLTAPVEKRVLKQSVVLRGDVAAAQSFEVTPTARGAGKSVVTAVKAKAGGVVDAGMVVLEVAGRPLVVLPGVKPAFRDLRPGYSGEDIRQLQAALTSLGYQPDETNGTFGPGTKSALAKYFAKIGYPPQPTSDADDALLASAAKQVKQSERALADAQETLGAAPPEQRNAAQKSVDRAVDDLAEARKALAELVSKTGPTLPLSEYVFLPSFPARVDALKAEVGGEVTAPAITLSSGALKVRALLNPGQRDSVKPGMATEIVSEALGGTAEGAVEWIGDLTTDKSNPAGSGYPMIVTPTRPLEQRLAGQNVRLTIAAASSDGEVLVIPLAALFSGADGRVSVIRQSADGREERVPVVPGLHGDGSVAVTGALAPGDRVVVGIQQK